MHGGGGNICLLFVPTYLYSFFAVPGAFGAYNVECARISLSFKMLFAFNSCVKIVTFLIEHIHVWRVLKQIIYCYGYHAKIY